MLMVAGLLIAGTHLVWLKQQNFESISFESGRFQAFLGNQWSLEKRSSELHSTLFVTALRVP
jgi:hypothetical protein